MRRKKKSQTLKFINFRKKAFFNVRDFYRIRNLASGSALVSTATSVLAATLMSASASALASSFVPPLPLSGSAWSESESLVQAGPVRVNSDPVWKLWLFPLGWYSPSWFGPNSNSSNSSNSHTSLKAKAVLGFGLIFDIGYVWPRSWKICSTFLTYHYKLPLFADQMLLEAKKLVHLLNFSEYLGSDPSVSQSAGMLCIHKKILIVIIHKMVWWIT